MSYFIGFTIPIYTFLDLRQDLLIFLYPQGLVGIFATPVLDVLIPLEVRTSQGQIRGSLVRRTILDTYPQSYNPSRVERSLALESVS